MKFLTLIKQLEAFFERLVFIEGYEIVFPVWLRNRLISAGLKLVLSPTKQFIYRIVLYPVFNEYGHQHLWANKTSFDHIFVHFYIRGKMSIIRCDK